MNRFSSCRRMAAICATAIFLLCAPNGAAQQSTAPVAQNESAVSAVPGITAANLESEQVAAPAETRPIAASGRGAPHSFGQFFKNIARDQAGMWTSPLRIRRHDLVWLIPFAGATAAAIATDARAVRGIDPNASYVRVTRDFTVTGAPYILLGAAGVTWFLGKSTHNDHLQETSILGAEAIVDSILVTGALKLAANRERPNQGSGEGHFWPHGTRGYPSGTAFPSGHAAASWAFARVIAGEYPKPAVKIVSYTLASLVSVARVTGRKHYPSDALVGSVFGYLIGEYVVRRRAIDREHGSSFTIAPFSDTRTHTRGVVISFSPDIFHIRLAQR